MQKQLIESAAYDGLKNGTHIDAEVYYSKGGLNPFSGDTVHRGYYLNVAPVRREGSTMSYTLFAGVMKLLMTTERYSQKQFEQAVELAKAETPGLIGLVLAKELAA